MNKHCKKIVLASLVAFAVSAGLSVASPMIADAKVHFDVFDFESHRGGRDARPENTLYSYAYAMELGATTIECDMQLTADGKIVMSHNAFLNHELTKDKDGNYIPDGKYDIRTMTVEQIKQFNVGHINPETAEYAHNVDPATFVKVFNDTVKKYGMEDRVVLQSFDWRTLIEMKKLNPNISTSALWQASSSWEKYGDQKSPWLGGVDIKDFKYNPVQAAHSIGADVISPYFKDISMGDVEEAHKLGMKVVPWTVNNESDMEMMLDMGVDGMISDKPWILKEVLQKRGIPLHKAVVNTKSPYHTGTAHNDVVTEKVTDGRDAAY